MTTHQPLLPPLQRERLGRFHAQRQAARAELDAARHPLVAAELRVERADRDFEVAAVAACREAGVQGPASIDLSTGRVSPVLRGRTDD